MEHDPHRRMLRALGFEARPRRLVLKRAGSEYIVPVAYADQRLAAIECGRAVNVAGALADVVAGPLLAQAPDDRERLITGAKAVHLLLTSDKPFRYILILAGGVIALAHRARGGDCQYLAVHLDAGDQAELATLNAILNAGSLPSRESGGGDLRAATAVLLALRYRMDRDGTITAAREILDWKICEPVLGSSAYLDEAVHQVAATYLRRRQRELGVALAPARYDEELRKVKAYVALHNAYGVAHGSPRAPRRGLHLRRGNALIGASRRVYSPERITDGTWLAAAADRLPLSAGPLPAGMVHHFLLPAEGWGATMRAEAPRDQLLAWRRAKVSAEKPGQLARLQALAGRVEYLWNLAIQRLVAAEREVGGEIDVWGADRLDKTASAVPRDDPHADAAYWRLETLMDTWCALWCWPVDKVDLLTNLASLDDWLDFVDALIGTDADSPQAMRERFPWLHLVDDVAERHSFVHWELHFAQVFHRGGFDLVAGCPPARRRELAADAGTGAFLSAPATYRLLGSRSHPDLDHAFTVQAWRIISAAGIAALVHPTIGALSADQVPLRHAAHEHLRTCMTIHHGRLLPDRLLPDVECGLYVYGVAMPS